MQFVVIASTNGSVLAALLKNDYFRSRIRCVVSDRPCAALTVAAEFGVPHKLYATGDGLKFSDFLLNEYQDHPPDLFICFYTRLLRGAFLAFAQGRLVNVHPSILPAFPGLHGFEDSVKAGSRFVGSTIHYVDHGMDTGIPILQAAAPFNPEKTLAENRHIVFIQQCKMVLQLIKYVEEKRIEDGANGLAIKHVSYQIGEFSPNLDADLPWHDLTPVA